MRRQRSLFAGMRDATGALLVDVYPVLRGFHAPRKDRLRQPMPPRITNKMKREQASV